MAVILEGFGLLIPYIFMLVVVGIIWNHVISAFRGRM